MKIRNLIILIVLGIVIVFWADSFALGQNQGENKSLAGDITATKPLTTAEKVEINSLITKQATGKMTYTEYLTYIKALNDNTTARVFTIDKSFNEILPILKTELSAKAK